MKTIIIGAIFFTMLTGCSLFEKRTLTPEEREQLYDHVLRLPSHNGSM